VAEPVRSTEHLPQSPADGPAPRVADAAARDRPRPDRWQELRALILGPERERLARVEETLADPQLNVDQVSRVLPEALERRANDRALGDALGPVVGEAIKASVRRDPQPLVDAVFPIIGPAIRRAIASAFAELVQSINTALEHSFTPRGLAWRFEALRTGRSFGEVVLSHSLVFRVEQLLVVHRETGLLVKHMTAPGVKALPSDMVAGMLTAITDFARDTFEMSVQDGLDSFALGDLTVWVEQGPAVMLAAVIRGHAPVALRGTLQQAVEDLQRVHAAQLERFGRDGAPFELREALLEPCLVSKLAEPSRRAGWWRVVALAALLLVGLGWWVVPRVLEGRRFDRYIAELQREPGVVVGSTGRAGRRFVVSGLRDPLARDPAQLLAGAGIDPGRVTAHWEPYVALRPEFVIRRANAVLQPPPRVQLALRGDTLAASGIASADWIADARRLGVAVGGVAAVDLSAVADSAGVALRAAADSLEARGISFGLGESFPVGGSRAVVDTIALALRRLLEGAAAARRVVSVEVWASTDSVGSEPTNAALRASRAWVLRNMLVTRGVLPAVLTINSDSALGGRRAALRIAIRSLPPGTP
jgi:OOP family OmpA-OmpF porin